MQVVAIALLAAGMAALAFVDLPLLWFIVGLLWCGLLALVAQLVARRQAVRTKNREVAQAHTFRLERLERTSDALKALDRAVERAQMDVLEGFRRERNP